MRNGFSNAVGMAKCAAVCVVLAAFAMPASAASIIGDLTFSGNWMTSDGGSLGSATGLVFPGGDFDVDGANGDYSGIAQGDIGSIADLALSGGTPSLLSIAGFTFSLDTVNIIVQNSEFLLLEGTGIVSGNGFDATVASFVLSANVNGDLQNFSAGITSVPVPAGIWLFASALAALGFRRK